MEWFYSATCQVIWPVHCWSVEWILWISQSAIDHHFSQLTRNEPSIQQQSTHHSPSINHRSPSINLQLITNSRPMNSIQPSIHLSIHHLTCHSPASLHRTSPGPLAASSGFIKASAQTWKRGRRAMNHGYCFDWLSSNEPVITRTNSHEWLICHWTSNEPVINYNHGDFSK